MSRFSEYDGDDEFSDDEFNGNGWAMWEKRAELALSGKRGRKALAELRDALLALPEQRLIADALCTVGAMKRIRPEVEARWPIERWGDSSAERLAYRQQNVDEEVAEAAALVAREGEGVCAIGAYLWHQKVKAGMDPAEAFAALPTLSSDDGDNGYETARLGEKAGLTYTLAWELASRNDETFAGMAPDVRYREFLRWIEAQLAKPPLAAAPRRVKKVRQPKLRVGAARTPAGMGLGL